MIRWLTIVVFAALSCLEMRYILCSEGKDNQGKHFIFGFMNNLPGAKPEVFITTNCKCTVNVTISTPGYDPYFVKKIMLNRHDVKKVAFHPNIQGGPGTTLNNKGIEIRSNEEITVYAVNKAKYSTDAFAVFPLDTLGNNYLVITWNNKAEFLIIGTEDNTTVNIVIADGTHITYDGVTYTAGMTLYITMNKYQTFHVFGGQDYTGTRITSTKKITVISGAYCTKIGAGACDHLSSQMTPVETFGNTFVTINMPNCNSPVNFKIVASENNTDVNITGKAQVSLSEPGDKYFFKITDQSSKVITSTKPITMAFFSEGGCGSPSGDPAMILLQPTQQFAADYTFTTIDYPTNSFEDALTIIIPESEISGLKLDAQNISANWRKIDGSYDLRITDINVTKGSHTVYHVNPTVIFLAISTGLAKDNSYGYSSGQRLAPINSNCTPTITIPGDIIDNDCDGLIDEELQDGIDNDGDGKVDEDLAKHIEELRSTSSSTKKQLPTTSMSTTSSTKLQLPSTLILTQIHSTTAPKNLTTLYKKSTKPTTNTTPNIPAAEIADGTLSTDLVIAVVVIAMFVICCFSTSMFFFKWKRRRYFIK